jgi:hypothetical protein
MGKAKRVVTLRLTRDTYVPNCKNKPNLLVFTSTYVSVGEMKKLCCFRHRYTIVASMFMSIRRVLLKIVID